MFPQGTANHRHRSFHRCLEESNSAHFGELELSHLLEELDESNCFRKERAIGEHRGIERKVYFQAENWL